MVMSDRIAIMRAGKFEQIATAEEIYSRPISRFVASFMGEVNLFPVTGRAENSPGGPSAAITMAPAALEVSPGWSGVLMVRPELVRFLDAGQGADFTLPGRLSAEYALGSRIQYSVETAAGLVTVERPFETRLDAPNGTEVTLGWDRGAVHLIAETADGTA